ncbi:MAG TPA: hypothetical protein VJB08_06825 [Candidatus Nanoarchaeia archaeon]|nr:hypothetical protein [Candidatus Nanoarchaeia archaeon]
MVPSSWTIRKFCITLAHQNARRRRFYCGIPLVAAHCDEKSLAKRRQH